MPARRLLCLLLPALAALMARPDLTALAQTDAAQREQVMTRGHVGDCVRCHGRADRNRYRFDAASSRVTVSLDGYGFARLVGTFPSLEGGFSFDPGKPERGSVAVSLRAADARFGDALIDAVARERFFEAERFPVISFTAKKVARAGAKSARLTGALTLRGVTREVTLGVRFNGAGRHPLSGDDVAGFSARGKLRRSAFGMTLGLPGIGDEVELAIEVVGRRLR